jgi:nucleolar protein 14
MPFKDKNKKKIKRKKGKKFVYNNPSDGLQKDKKKNPFEELSKKKHTKQIKEYKGILNEYKNRFTTNTFIDRRIGEHSKNLSQDEKMKLRFKAQQLINLKNKKNKFSLLNDDDDNLDDHLLTHRGMKLDQVVDDEMEKSDDELYDKMDNYMEEMDNNKKLSRKEIIQNIINKSKMLKMEKQKLKKETKDQIQLLDDNFGELSTLLKKRGRTFNTVRDDYDKFAKIFENSDKTHPTVIFLFKYYRKKSKQIRRSN